MVHIQKNDVIPDGEPKALKYVWAQRQMQPWGKPLPAQCPQCRAFRPWGPRKNFEEDGSKVARFFCGGKYKKSLCGYVFEVVIPKNLIKTEGDWLKVGWPVNGNNCI